MSYENARNGIGKVWTSQVLFIIYAILGGITGIFLVLFFGAAATESEVGTGVSGILTILFFVASEVISLIAFILELVGLNKAGKDSDQIKKAFTLTIVNFILAIVFGIFNSPLMAASWVKSLIEIVMLVLNLLITYNILFGCAGLKSELTEKANSTWKMYMIVVILDIVIAIVAIIMGLLGGTALSATLFIIVVVADIIFDIIAFFMTLSFLNNARKVL